MKDSYILGVVAILATAVAFTIWEIKRNQRLLYDILKSVGQLRTLNNIPEKLKPDIQQHILNNNIDEYPDVKMIPPIIYNESDEKIENLESDIEKYQSQLEVIDQELGEDNISSDYSDDLDMDEMVEKVNNNIELMELSESDEDNFKNNEDFISTVVTDADIVSRNTMENNNADSDVDLIGIHDLHPMMTPVAKNSLDYYYDKYTKKELQIMCRDKDIVQSGTKNDMINRLLTIDAFDTTTNALLNN